MDQKNQIQLLLDFVQKATKLGKYNTNTGNGLLNAIRAAEKGLSSEEPKEIEYLLDHMEELFFRQNNNLSPQSLAVYFTRIRRAAEDYRKYGTDARSIYSWSPKLRPKKVSKKNSTQDREEQDSNIEESQIRGHDKSQEIIREVGGVKLNVVTWRLRPGVLIKIELPEDLTTKDVEKIKNFLDLEID